MNWSIFAQIAEKIEQPLLTAVSGVSDNLLSAVFGTFRTAMVLYVAMVGLMIVNGRMNEPLRDTWGRLAKGAAVAVLDVGRTPNATRIGRNGNAGELSRLGHDTREDRCCGNPCHRGGYALQQRAAGSTKHEGL